MNARFMGWASRMPPLMSRHLPIPAQHRLPTATERTAAPAARLYGNSSNCSARRRMASIDRSLGAIVRACGYWRKLRCMDWR